jgi:glutathionylspermidine synthase
MRVVHHPITFDLETVVREELPFMSAFYRYKGQLNSDVQDLLAFPVANQEAMPFYTIKESTTYKLNQQFEHYYNMMLSALEFAFEDRELLSKYFDCQFLREHGDRFIPYAKATFERKHPALYGRFDACFDPETEELLGVYEFNGDTPVMLFESVNLQARFSQELGTDQYNNWWDIATGRFRYEMKNFAVVCGTDYVEDMATCETVAQAFQTAKGDRNVSFLDLKELDFDHMRIGKPFIARDDVKPLDGMYILSPWEEMVENFPTLVPVSQRDDGSLHAPHADRSSFPGAIQRYCVDSNLLVPARAIHEVFA